ncbi:MAG: hypothetical protein LBH43_16860 [Treponema sp.]|jgi:hypothetical protein|nr:hypothetical protein [Treponema sp.]
MLISFHGSDEGNAMLIALVLILVLSLVFISLISRISIAGEFVQKNRAKVIYTIEQSNREIISKYDLY